MISQLYREQREALLTPFDQGRANGDEPVPACPGWTTGDLVRHGAGLGQDWLTARLEVYASAEWTNDQVARFADQSVAEVAERWRAMGPDMEALLDDMAGADGLPEAVTTVVGRFPISTFGPGIVVDLTLHVADLHAALDLASPIPQSTLETCNRIMSGGLRGVWAANPELASVTLQATDGGQELALTGPGPDTVTGSGSTYDLFRSLGGRRTTAQIRALDWRGPDAAVDQVVAHLVVPFFAAPTTESEALTPAA